jgi:hypothetical protein
MLPLGAVVREVAATAVAKLARRKVRMVGGAITADEMSEDRAERMKGSTGSWRVAIEKD